MENVSTFYNIISMAPTYILSILDDLDIRYSRSSSAGGQNVNKGLYAISHPLKKKNVSLLYTIYNHFVCGVY